VKLKELLIE
jgi:hypothetical protein